MTYKYKGDQPLTDAEQTAVRVLAEARRIRAEALATLRLAQATTAHKVNHQRLQKLADYTQQELARQTALHLYPDNPADAEARLHAAAHEAANWHKRNAA